MKNPVYFFTESRLWGNTVDWTRYLFGRETRDQAWIEGAHQAEAEMKEYIEEKEAWIGECEWLIDELLKAIDTADAWHLLSPQAQESSRNHL